MSADVPPEPLVLAWMQWAVKYGLWEIISTIVIVVSALAGFKLLFWTKRHIPNLNFFLVPYANHCRIIP
jgi:hypothetical protein